MKNWKQILYRAVAVLSAVAVFTVQVPDLRMRAYAVDPFTAMAGEEVVSYVISAIAAACGVNISSDSSDVAADVRFWVSQAKDDYEIRARVADKEVVKTVAAVSFVRAQEYFQSLADKTFTLVDNGLAVPKDVMDAVSAYFNAKTKAYTDSMISDYPVAVVNGIYSGGFSGDFVYDRGGDHFSDYFDIHISIPSGVSFVRQNNCFSGKNLSDSTLEGGFVYSWYSKGKFIKTESFMKFVAPGDFLDFSHGFLGNDNIPYPTSIASQGTSGGTVWPPLHDYLNRNLDSRSASVVDNGVWTEAIPSDNWEWEVLDGGLSGTGEDAEVIKLYPTPETPDPDKLQEQLANALVTLEVGKLLEDLGFNKKTGADVPTPTLSPDESESPSIDPSENPSVDPSENPSVDPSESPSVDPSESASINPSENPDPGGDPDFSLSQLWEGLVNWLKSIIEWLKSIWEAIVSIPGQIIDFFTIKPESIQEAYGDLADAFQGRFSGIKQLGSVFNVSRVFDRTVPYFTMPTPDPFKFAIDSPTIVVLDLRPFEDMFVWVRRILNAILWYAFASWFINQFDVKLHIG